MICPLFYKGEEMVTRVHFLVLPFLMFFFLHGTIILANPNKETLQRIQTAPSRDLRSTVIDGTGVEVGLHGIGNGFQGFDQRKLGNSKVSVFSVAWLTLAMAAATGLGALPFFFVELEPEWAGVCNGLAAGVMLAASFDLIHEGQSYGDSNWVVVGIMSGAIFILLCKKVSSISIYIFNCFFPFYVV